MSLSSIDLQTITRIAILAAKQGGAILLDYAKKGFQIHKKEQAINLVTEADIHSEKAIIATIRHAFPEHQILSEEQGLQDIPAHATKWIIDPLDGTTNFAHGFPMYNVSIGVEHEGTCILGVIYDPTRDELFLGQQGHGATNNKTPIHVSATPKLSEALLVTGFAYDVHTATDNNFKEFGAFTLCARVCGAPARLPLISAISHVADLTDFGSCNFIHGIPPPEKSLWKKPEEPSQIT